MWKGRARRPRLCARENIELMLGALEKVQLGDGVVVRLGHATHATPEQLARMAKMGIIVEANVGSNLATGSIATPDSHPLLLNMYYGVSTVLSTDGAGVMRTNLQVEYLRAAAMIEQFKSGQVTLATKEGNVKYEDLTDRQKARFSVSWLTEQLAAYYAVADAPVSKDRSR